MRLILIVWLSCTVASAATRYLDRAATGLNDGTSWANAWTNAQVAAEGIKSGETLYIQGGDYDMPGVSPTVNFAGKTGIQVLIATNATRKATFAKFNIFGCDNSVFNGWLNNTQYFQVFGNSINGASAVLLRRSTNAVVSGFEITRQRFFTNDTSETHCLVIQDGYDWITVSNCYVHHTSGDGINAKQGRSKEGWDRLVVRNCYIEAIGDDGIQFGYGWGVSAIGNQIHNRRFKPLFQNQHPDGIQVNPNGGQVKIMGNLISEFTQGIFVEKALNSYIIANNCLVETRTKGFYAGICVGADPKKEFNPDGFAVVANNVCYGYRAFFGWKGGDTIQRVPKLFVRNNVFVNCKFIAYGDFKGRWAKGDGNFYWDEPGTRFYDSGSGEPMATPADRKAGSMTFADPRFVDATHWDFRIRPNSPLIGAGTNLDKFFTIDAAGKQRGEVWDAGAYQHAP